MPGGRRHLVTGATGYVGGRLARRLVEDGRDVRVLVRDPAGLPAEPWVEAVEVVTGSVDDPVALAAAVRDVEVAYYLVHAMSDGDDYADRDLAMARAFAAACEEAGVGRIVYLGGLWPKGVALTEHLRSRREVGDALLASSVPAAVLQAGVVLGRGSASYDLLAFVAERLPVVVGPDWLAHRVQPIAVDDLLVHLLAAADLPADVDRAFDVGGPDVVTYADLIRAYAEATGRRRPPVLTVPLVPRLLPHTLSLLAGTLTPGPSSLNAALVHSLSVDMVVLEDDFAQHLPEGYRRAGVAEALRAAARGDGA